MFDLRDFLRDLAGMTACGLCIAAITMWGSYLTI